MKVIFCAKTDWISITSDFSLILAVRSLGVDVPLVSPDGPYVVKFATRAAVLNFRW